MHVKRGYWITLVVVISIIVLGILSSQRNDNLTIIYADEHTVLNNDDFIINTPTGEVRVGQSYFIDIQKLFPQGNFLGMSTIYSPDTDEVLFTFTENEDILYRLHTTSNKFITNRGIKAGDSFTQVEKAYGSNYDYVHEENCNTSFDAVYGNDNNAAIIFQVRDGIVKKVIVQKDPVV